MAGIDESRMAAELIEDAQVIHVLPSKEGVKRPDLEQSETPAPSSNMVAVRRRTFWRPYALRSSFLGFFTLLVTAIAILTFVMPNRAVSSAPASGDVDAAVKRENPSNTSTSTPIATATTTEAESSLPTNPLLMSIGCEGSESELICMVRQSGPEYDHTFNCTENAGDWTCIDVSTGDNINCNGEPDEPVCSLILAFNRAPTAPFPNAFTSFEGFPLGSYFEAVYLPTLVGVLLSMLWDLTNAAVQETSPFYQLARPQGASADESLFSTGWSYTPVRWSILVSSVIKICVAFSSEVVFIDTSGECSSIGNGTDCSPSLALRPVVALAEGSLLVIVAFASVGFLIYYTKHPSGVYTDPTSLFGLAVLVSNPEILNDVHQSSKFTTKNANLSNRRGPRYQLNASPSDDCTRLGLRIVPNTSGGSLPQPLQQRQQQQRHTYKSLVVHLGTLTLFWTILAGLTAMIIFYYFVGTPSGFESFFDSQSIGPRLLMTAVGIAIKTYWKRVEKYVHVTEVYRHMARGPTSAHSSILVESSASPITTIPRALRCQHFAVTACAAMLLLAEVLTVTLAGVPFSSAQSHTAYVVSTWISFGILAVMLAVVPMLAWHLRGPVMHDVPTTVGEKLLCLREGSLVAQLQDLATIDVRQRRREVNKWRLKYRFAQTSGYDCRQVIVVPNDKEG